MLPPGDLKRQSASGCRPPGKISPRTIPSPHVARLLLPDAPLFPFVFHGVPPFPFEPLVPFPLYPKEEEDELRGGGSVPTYWLKRFE
jgi:hypothetical protein